VLPNHVDPTSETYQANAAAMTALVEQTRALADVKRRGGSQKARERHVANGKLLPRQRYALEGHRRAVEA
jgi:3-methylcrotonyl-CoA carboxylase beta subunit